MTSSHVLSAEELADRKYPSNVVLSNDGRCVAFVVQPMGRDGEHDTSEIWLSRDGKSARKFSAGLTADTSPVFSPDSTHLAFLSDRKNRGKQRIYLLPLDGGEAVSVSDLEGELSSLSWSPDGTQLSVLLKDPETADEKKRSEEKNDPILEEQNLKFARLWVVNAETGTSRQLSFGNRHVGYSAWSRDGKSLAFVTSPRTDDEGEFREVELGLISVAGGRVRPLATLRGAPCDLIFVNTSVGEQIAMRFNGFTADPVDSIWLISTETGESHELLTDDHGNVEQLFAIADRPAEIGLRMVDTVHGNAYIVDLESGERHLTLSPDWQNRGTIAGGPVYSGDGSTLAIVWMDPISPEEVYLAKRDQAPNKLTSFGELFAGRLNPSEIVEWQSDHWKVQGHLIYPQGYEKGKRYPLLIEAHGGPSWQWEDHCFLDWHDWAQFMASRGFAVLAPNPRGSTGRGAAFQKALQNDVGGGEVRDLIAGAKAMVERGIADPERLGIGGWSWGGYLTATTITRTQMFKAAMMGAGLSNLVSDHGTDDIPTMNHLLFPGDPYQFSGMYWASSALKCVADCTTPTLIIHGDADDRVHPTQGREMFTALSRLGVDTEFVRYPRQGHTIKERNYQIDLLNRMTAWFEKYLKT